MKNIDIKTNGNQLVITVDLSKDYGPSSSGKSTIVASTAGNIELSKAPGVFVGVNVYRKNSG